MIITRKIVVNDPPNWLLYGDNVKELGYISFVKHYWNNSSNPNDQRVIYEFSDETDAVMFKLRFGGN